MSTETNAKTRRLVQIAVTSALATTALAGCTGKVAPSHAYSASQAEAALAEGRHSKAITNAEAAVLAAPRDAQTRTLLGNAYLGAGRFQSAATTFGEALELGDSSARTVISYALALTAVGNQAGAFEVLREHQAAIDPADYGLAMALAGRPQEGVHVLGNALRNGQNNAKIRQNLAYAYALSGDWSNARLIAAQDVPADQLGDRMAQWALLTQSYAPSQRVASLLGVSISPDPGQPAMLALANHSAVEHLAAESAGSRETRQETSFALASELPAANDAPVFDDSAEAALADASLHTTVGTRFVSREVVQPIDATTATAPQRIAKSSPRGPERAVATGNYNVQLGSFSSVSDAHEAWNQFQRRYPELGNAEKVITKARVNGKIYYRVAAAGFAKGSAASMCQTVKRKGGGCIAYAASNPLPGALDVMRNGRVRVAAR